MPKKIKVNNWTEFKESIKEIKREHGVSFQGSIHEEQNTILYRGLANSKWSLQTTLERYTDNEKYTLIKYLQRAISSSKEIEAFTGKNWNLPTFPVLREIAKEIMPPLLDIPCYDYLTYLRHYGFPSPLLDWTKSPYIASFFAYAEAEKKVDSAVYVYIHKSCKFRSCNINEPVINLHGPFTNTDKRHFSQKAFYTTSTLFKEDTKQHVFSPHEKAFEQTQSCDIDLYKFILPHEAKDEALEEMQDFNLDYYSIFHTEDALIKSVAMRSLKV